MDSRSSFYCWEIMQCDKSKKCPARANPQKPCWEVIAQIDDDYRSFFNVCRDCIVHVLKAGASGLSEKELRIIVKKKTGNMQPGDHLRLLPRKPGGKTTSPWPGA